VTENTKEAPVNTRALDAALITVGVALGMPQLHGLVRLAYVALDNAQAYGENSMRGQMKDQYDSGYLDGANDMNVAPEVAMEHSDYIEEQRALRTAAFDLDPTLDA
jgi:hypothetical protein